MTGETSGFWNDDTPLPPPIGSDDDAAQEEGSVLPKPAPLIEDPAKYLDAAPTEPSIFVVDFVYGASLRQLIEFLKRVAKELPLVLSKHGISTAVCGASRQITAHAVIRREDLTRFIVDESRANYAPAPNDQEWYHVVNVDSGDLFEQISKVGKRDAVRIFQPKETPNEIRVLSCCFVKGAVQTRFGTVRIRPYTPVSYSIVENPRRFTTEPNVTMQLSRFCATISSFAKKRAEKAQAIDKIELALFENSVSFTGLAAGGRPPPAVETVTFGARPAEGAAPSSRVVLSMHTLPALLKITGVSADSVVRLYASNTNLVRAEVAVGCYGVIRIFLSGAARGRGAK